MSLSLSLWVPWPPHTARPLGTAAGPTLPAPLLCEGGSPSRLGSEGAARGFRVGSGPEARPPEVLGGGAAPAVPSAPRGAAVPCANSIAEHTQRKRNQPHTDPARSKSNGKQLQASCRGGGAMNRGRHAERAAFTQRNKLHGNAPAIKWSMPDMTVRLARSKKGGGAIKRSGSRQAAVASTPPPLHLAVEARHKPNADS